MPISHILFELSHSILDWMVLAWISPSFRKKEELGWGVGFFCGGGRLHVIIKGFGYEAI